MSTRSDKRILKGGAGAVFVGGAAAGAALAWRLDVRDEGGRRPLLAKRRRSAPRERTSPKLFHYIAAGGMRQLRRTTADDLLESRRRSFALALGALAAVWLAFYFIPSL